MENPVKRIFRHPDDSLDLLLDAMCNMFGGIMFIALLVVVIAAAAPARRPAQPLPDRAAALRKLRLLSDRTAALRKQNELSRRLAPAADRTAASDGEGPAEAEAEAVARYRALERQCRGLATELRQLRSANRQQGDRNREKADYAAWPEARKPAEIERLKAHNARLRGEIAALPMEAWVFAPPEKTDLRPWRMILAGNRLYPVGDNAAVRRGGGPDSPVAIAYRRYDRTDYWQLAPRPGRGIPLAEFDWRKWAAAVSPQRYFPELLTDPGDLAGAAAVRRELRRLGYRQNFQVRRPEELVLAAREGEDYEASR